MNAQEAIEMKEKEVQEGRRKVEIWRTISNGNNEAVDRHERSIEALSIVLESAKLFHQHTIPMLESKYPKLGFSNVAETVFGVPLEKVGINKIITKFEEGVEE